METGLEKMRNRIMEDTIHWTQIDYKYEDCGDGVSIWYNKSIDVTCYMYYEQDMDQELYLVKIEFVDGEDWQIS